MRIKRSTIAINLVALPILVFSGADILFAIALLLWLNIIIYAFRDTGSRSMLLAFAVSFFTFLMGRELVQQFLSYKIDNFDTETNHHLYLCIILSLTFLMCGYLFCNRRMHKIGSSHALMAVQLRSEIPVDPIVKDLSKYLFYASWIFAMISKLIVARFVSSYGYTNYYTDYSEFLTGNLALYAISKLEGIMPVALSIFSAALPSKKEYGIPSLMYVAYMMASLATGQRSAFILGILFLMVYYLYRNKHNPEERWITKNMIIAFVMALPLLAVFMTILSTVRMGETAQRISIVDGVLSFLYDQGVTGNIVKRAFMYKDRIPNQIYTLEFLHSGLFARLLKIPIYHGNTVEHALYGGSFTHAVAYVILGQSYLVGVGTGSSYIAELFYDFGYIGVVIGNFIYGYIIAYINHPVTKNNVFRMSVSFYIITQILWAPRASLTGFLSNLFAPMTIFSFLLVFGLANEMRDRYEGVFISINE